MTFKCPVCDVDGREKCSNCFLVGYCSKEHKKKHWPDHNANCFPVIVKGGDDDVAKCLKSTRKIKAGEIILKEKPILIAPIPMVENSIICISCGATPLLDIFKCTTCKLPMCGQSCMKSDIHIAECSLIKKPIVNLAKEMQKNKHFYLFIATLRGLYTKIADLQKWDKLISMKFIADTPTTREIRIMAKKLVSTYELNEYELSHVVNILGGIKTNSFSLDYNRLFGLYDKSQSIQHSCRPNCYKLFNINKEIVVKASITIPKNEKITISYCPIFDGYYSRNKFLQEHYYFTCNCSRCQDATDRDTHYDSYLCLACGKGLVAPPIGNRKEWKCNLCGRVEKEDVVRKKLNTLYLLMKSSNDIFDYEFFSKYTKDWLSENHHLRIAALANLLTHYHAEELKKPSVVSCLKRGNHISEICCQLLKCYNIIHKGHHPDKLSVRQFYLSNLSDIFKSHFYPVDLYSEKGRRMHALMSKQVYHVFGTLIPDSIKALQRSVHFDCAKAIIKCQSYLDGAKIIDEAAKEKK